MFKTLKKNLVISTIGDRSLHRNWTSNSPIYDSFLVYYGDQAGFNSQSTYYKQAKGYKYPLIQALLQENPWIFDYQYIWLPDDDVLATPHEIEHLFSTMQEFDLWLAQPSIMGYYSIDVTLTQPKSKLRYCNWVEIMCPCFSSYALKKCCSSFNENNTGWSLEGVWNVLLDHPRDKIAIIDDVTVLHTRQVLTGDTYSDKSEPLNYALQEGKRVHEKWNLGAEYKKDVSHGQLIDSEIKYFVLYKQIKKETPNDADMTKRVFPSILKNLLPRTIS